jgi:predicted RNA polymerase sigma factor
VVASVLRIVRDIDAAQEVVRGFRAGARSLARSGPRIAGAWLLHGPTRALDHRRRTRRAGARVDALAHAGLGATHPAPDVSDPDEIPDDRLRLIFTCCHPALPADSRVALTLRLVGGLSTTEIARAFLVSEPTIAQRLVRAKRTIREGGFPYEVPEGPAVARLSAVLRSA